MKKVEKLIPYLLIMIGITSLTVAGTVMFKPESLSTYFSTLLTICIFILIPFVLYGMYVYFINKHS